MNSKARNLPLPTDLMRMFFFFPGVGWGVPPGPCIQDPGPCIQDPGPCIQDPGMDPRFWVWILRFWVWILDFGYGSSILGMDPRFLGMDPRFWVWILDFGYVSLDFGYGSSIWSMYPSIWGMDPSILGTECDTELRHRILDAGSWKSKTVAW